MLHNFLRERVIGVTSRFHPGFESHDSAPALAIPIMGMIVKRNHSHKGKRELPINRTILPDMGNQLRNLRLSRRWTIDKAANEIGMSYGGYLKLERGDRRLKAEQIARIAAVYGVADSDVIGSRLQVYVIGRVDASGRIITFDEAGGPLQLAPAPDGSTNQTVAYRVEEGAVLQGIAEENWLIYHDEPVAEVPDEWIGKFCVCELKDGERFICKIFYGKVAGTYDLVGTKSDHRRGQEVRSVALVTWTKQQ